MRSLHLVLTSNWVSRLFFAGAAGGGIEKCEANFFKGEKAAAFQLRPDLQSGWRRKPMNL